MGVEEATEIEELKSRIEECILLCLLTVIRDIGLPRWAGVSL